MCRPVISLRHVSDTIWHDGIQACRKSVILIDNTTANLLWLFKLAFDIVLAMFIVFSYAIVLVTVLTATLFAVFATKAFAFFRYSR